MSILSFLFKKQQKGFNNDQLIALARIEIDYMFFTSLERFDKHTRKTIKIQTKIKKPDLTDERSQIEFGKEAAKKLTNLARQVVRKRMDRVQSHMIEKDGHYIYLVQGEIKMI